MRVFRSPPSSPNKEWGFTLIELMVVLLILSVIIAAVFITLKSGYFSQSLSSQQTELQLIVRTAAEHIIKDLRQARSSQLTGSSSQLSFDLCSFDPQTETWMNCSTIVYNYDSNNKILTRTNDGTEDLKFENIIEAPFDTTYLVSDKKVILELKGERGSIAYTLKSEIKLRNE